jgi:hypothetical protein
MPWEIVGGESAFGRNQVGTLNESLGASFARSLHLCDVVKLHTHDFNHDQQHLTCRQPTARVAYTIISHSTNRRHRNTLQCCDRNIPTSSASKEQQQQQQQQQQPAPHSPCLKLRAAISNSTPRCISLEPSKHIYLQFPALHHH